MVGRPRVLIADDHLVMLQTLVRLLEIECDVVATARDGLAAVAAAEQNSPEVLVRAGCVDACAWAVRAAAQLVRQGSPARFVFVTMHHDRESVQESMTLTHRVRHQGSPRDGSHARHPSRAAQRAIRFVGSESVTRRRPGVQAPRRVRYGSSSSGPSPVNVDVASEPQFAGEYQPSWSGSS